MKKKLWLILVIFTLIFTACAIDKKSQKQNMQSKTEIADNPTIQEKVPKNTVVSPDKKYTAYLVGEVWEQDLYISEGSDFKNAKKIRNVDYFTDLYWSENSQYVIVDDPRIKRALIFKPKKEFMRKIDYQSGPFWSPSGDMVCYTKSRTVWIGNRSSSVETTDLLVESLNSELHHTALARGTKDYHYIVDNWDKDGKIKFRQISTNENKVLAELSTEYAHYLWAFDINTGKGQKLAKIDDLEYHYFNPSPNRKWLSLVRRTFSGGEAEGGIPAFYNMQTGQLIELDKEFGTWFWNARWFKDSSQIMLNETTIYNVETKQFNKLKLPDDAVLLGGGPTSNGKKLIIFACKSDSTNNTEGQPLILYVLDSQGKLIKTHQTSLMPNYSNDLQGSLPVYFECLAAGEKIVLESWNQKTYTPSVQLLDITSGKIDMNIAEVLKPAVSPDNQKIAVLELENTEKYTNEYANVCSLKVLTLDGKLVNSLHVKNTQLDYFKKNAVIWDCESKVILAVGYKNDQKYLVKWDLTTGETSKIKVDNSTVPLYIENGRIICISGNIIYKV